MNDFSLRKCLIFSLVNPLSGSFRLSDNLSDVAQAGFGLAPRAGVEPATSGLGIQHSVQLSYRGIRLKTRLSEEYLGNGFIGQQSYDDMGCGFKLNLDV